MNSLFVYSLVIATQLFGHRLAFLLLYDDHMDLYANPFKGHLTMVGYSAIYLLITNIINQSLAVLA